MRLTISFDPDDYAKIAEYANAHGVKVSRVISYAAIAYIEAHAGRGDNANIAMSGLNDVEDRIAAQLRHVEAQLAAQNKKTSFLIDLCGNLLRALLARLGPDRTKEDSFFGAAVEREFWSIYTHTVKNSGWAEAAADEIMKEFSGGDNNHVE
jgi:hypothetical protein